jgi:hypothetical protein
VWARSRFCSALPQQKTSKAKSKATKTDDDLFGLGDTAGDGASDEVSEESLSEA